MKSATNFRLEETTLLLLSQLASQLQTSRTDIVEQAVVAYARIKMEKHSRLMALAGSFDEIMADEMLSDIKQSRRSKKRDFAE